MMKKIFAILLACMLLFLCACNAPEVPETQPATEPAETTEATEATEALEIIHGIPVPWETPEPEKPDFSGIDELTANADGVYQIYSAKGLANMAEHPDGSFVLLWDVDLEGAAWTPVPEFSGTFDGGNYTISNFTVTEAANTGFFGTLTGTVKNLNLANVTLSAAAGNLGGIAGENCGAIMDCTVGGTMTVSGTAVAGGLVGKMTQGTLERSTCTLRIEAAEGCQAGLLGGQLENVTLEKCIYDGKMNTQNGELLSKLAGSAKGVSYPDCCYRDNTGSDEFLEESNLQMRLKAVEKMRAMGTFKWVAPETLMYLHPSSSVGSGVYVKGMVYHGMPYTSNFGSFERFRYALDENGVIKDFVMDLGTQGSDIFDMYMGNDCSGAVYWAWLQFSDSTKWMATSEMIPSKNLGGVAIGTYDCEGIYDTMQILTHNGDAVIAEAYTKLQVGDAVVTYYNDPKDASNHMNHTRMLAQTPAVMRNPDGSLNVEESYIITHGQGDGLSEAYPSTWEIDHKYTFKSLLNGQYIPVSCIELVNGTPAECVITVDEPGEGKGYLTTGTVSSNYRLISTTITIADSQGNAVFEKTLFSSVGKGADYMNTDPFRVADHDYDLAAFAGYLRDLELTEGETYTYTLSAMPATGESVELKTFTFVG